MATIRELRDRIASIDNTMKITNAMYLISSTKLRKAKADLEKTEPYFYTLQTTMSRILRHLPEDFTHPYLDSRTALREEIKLSSDDSMVKTAIICVTADKGMAGAYNHNVIRQTEEILKRSPQHKLFVVGDVGRVYFRNNGVPIEETFLYTAQNPTLHRARTITGRMLDLFEAHEIDAVYIVYTRMHNSLEMKAEIQQLLPLDKLHNVNMTQIPMVAGMEEFKLRPTPKAIIDNIVPSYMSGFIYSALVESFCAEQSARMTAMDNANRNGGELKSQLRILYNRVRQAKITQEITEVAAGAKAQQK